jgi:hypothetical protein
MASITFDNWANVDRTSAELSMKYDEYQSYRDKNRGNWEEIESYMYATDCLSIDGLNQYDHTTHIPITAELKEEAEAIMYNAILPHADFLGWQPFDVQADTQETRRKVLAYIKNRHMMNGFEQTFRQLIQDLVMYGNCFCQVRYVNEQDNGIGYVGPKPFRISPYDIVFDPTRSDFVKSPKFIREVMSIEELDSWAQATEGVDESVVEAVKERRLNWQTLTKTEINKNKQYVPDGFADMQAYYQSGKVEVLWFYGDVYDHNSGELLRNRCVVLVDRVNTLLNIEDPDPNIFKGSWSQKPDNLWSQGPLDKIIGINYQINHRENSKSDAMDRAIYPDRVIQGEGELIYDPETGRETWQMVQGGTVQDIAPDTTVLSADLHIDRLMAFARAAAGLPPQMQGFRTPGEKTLGEVQNLEDAAMRKFLHRAAQFEMDVLEQVVRAEILIGRDHFDSVIQASTTDEEGIPLLLEITQDDLKANGKLVPMGARRFARRNQQMNMLNMLASGNLGQLVLPHMSMYQLAKAVEELGEFSDFGIVEKFASIAEQGEAQLEQAIQQQQLAGSLGNPSAQEILNEEEGV